MQKERFKVIPAVYLIVKNGNDILLSLDLKDITNTGKYSNISVEANIPMNTKLIKIEPSYFDIEISAKNDTTNNNK